jgi:hypothetical protein
VLVTLVAGRLTPPLRRVRFGRRLQRLVGPNAHTSVLRRPHG